MYLASPTQNELPIQRFLGIREQILHYSLYFTTLCIVRIQMQISFLDIFIQRTYHYICRP